MRANLTWRILNTHWYLHNFVKQAPSTLTTLSIQSKSRCCGTACFFNKSPTGCRRLSNLHANGQSTGLNLNTPPMVFACRALKIAHPSITLKNNLLRDCIDFLFLLRGSRGPRVGRVTISGDYARKYVNSTIIVVKSFTFHNLPIPKVCKTYDYSWDVLHVHRTPIPRSM